MKLHRGPGLFLFLFLCVLGAAWVVASRMGYLDTLQARFFPSVREAVRLSPGDFPAGVSAPVADVASVPLRPVLIGFTARGSAASLLVAAGGATTLDNPAAPPGAAQGVLKTAYALDARAVLFAREEELRQALAIGAENGGVDMGFLSVDRLASWAPGLRDAAPRTLLLVGRSRGQEALAAVGVTDLASLRGKRVGVYPFSSTHYFALWVLARAGLRTTDVKWVDLPSTLDAGRALREGRADAVVGLWGDVELAARDRGGAVLATTADAPHLVATVLVARGDFAARYPDAVRRVLRGMLDAGQAVLKDPAAGARMLGEVAPYLGDPTEAIRSAPPATLADNRAFFGLSGEAPVTYDELYQSAAALFQKLKQGPPVPLAEDTRDLGALKYVSEARGP
ncbi:ABC transporter substrate-binding protein [Myxococcus sp. MISCRS1]|jgi:ABC-type nitrate/sulfonate/bicarbonate transport system substrate-binding protein|uniref:ABC transporter substrate-binding protein n=1 Tax=Myxococcus TaxID=32 RepID=UPI001CC0418F|nr:MULTISPECIES: ABC transporter substrate-binding protein [Myxococcus]BDT36769.1 ABC transporter substrate-binding protein [Myxococcus sp. MH1]MBZ4394689.1 ABC transporter substrate-binding protein [Myxococcus sp. AS-1-15]MBZ4410161.1 ABC transporter substrate-binding protein [Myxococcus sp. XM-1-1-1]MCK8497155.1 ABC transporter substrate-binding protein [Myxococcus fulvus]MCY1001660.1 ABC transporter substrate-binding protein [Myxococcus sp. MISCRS1]